MQTALALDAITLDPDLQPREQIDDSTAEHYAQVMQSGGHLPPVTVFFDGEKYWLADGFHRLRAYRNWLQLPTIPAEVHTGDRAAALRFSLAANAEHGRPREAGDIRKAYGIAVKYELCQPDDTAAVRALLNCTERWARTLTKPARKAEKLIRDLKIAVLAAKGTPEREIALQVGVDKTTVSKALGGGKRNRAVSPHPAPAPPADPQRNAAVLAARLTHMAGARWSELLTRLDRMNEETDVAALLNQRRHVMEPRLVPALEQAITTLSAVLAGLRPPKADGA